MGDKKIEIGKDVHGIANVENGATVHQYFNITTTPVSTDTKSIDDNKCKKIEEYPFYRNIEKDKYICQKGQISIEANLPKINFPMSFLIECEISFKLENNRTIIVKLDNEATLKELFSLYMYFFEEKDEQDNKMITYTSNHVTLDISIGTFNTLIYIANDLQEVYTERINQLEDRLESKDFVFSSEYQNGLELCEISQELWSKIPEFINRDSETINELGIFMSSNNEYFMWTDDKMISASIQKNYDREFKKPIKIILVWNTLDSDISKDEETKIKTVREVYNWLVTTFIPEVEKLENLDNTIINYLKYESDEEYINKNFMLIMQIVSYFNIISSDVIFNKNNLKNLYEGLILLLENSKRLDIDGLKRLFFYIGNVNTIPVYSKDKKVSNPTKEYFINRINIELEEIKKGDMSMKELIGNSMFTLREILNCYVIIFNTNGEDDYPSIIIHEVYQKLKSFEKVSKVFSTRERMMMPFWE